MLKIAKPRDRKAPRFRWSKYRHNVLNRDLFKSFKTKFPKSSINEWSKFKAIIEEFNTAFSDEVVTNRDGAKLPGHMGFMALCSFKPKMDKLTPKNWGGIDETGLQIKDLNLQTDELACKIIYSVYHAKYKSNHMHIWKFVGCRQFKTKASMAFRKNFNKFKRLTSKCIVSKIFKDDYIRTNFQYKSDEQGSELGQPDNR